jgi:hypothetical protein
MKSNDITTEISQVSDRRDKIIIEADVTHWQEFEEYDTVQQGQERNYRDSNLTEHAEIISINDQEPVTLIPSHSTDTISSHTLR